MVFIHYYSFFRSLFNCCLLLMISTVSYSVNAQNVTLIPHVTGSALLGGTTVTVSHTGQINSNIIGGCGLQAQHIGNQYDSIYYYKFSHPTLHMRFAFQGTDYGEEMYFKVNGVFYPLTNNHIDNFAANTCNCQSYALASGGRLVFTLNMPSQNCTQVDIYYPGIDSVSIHHNNLMIGTLFNAFFSADTTTFIKQPFIDTLLCQGQQFPLLFKSNFRFNNNNTFTAQLSNSSGSFANPVNIGTLADTSGDTILCRIPLNTPVGNGYRIRIVSSNVSDTSLDNQVNIRVKEAPQNFSNSSNSPVCTGNSVQLSGISTSTGVTWAWTGPNNFTAATQNAAIPNSTMSHAGDYILQATLNSTGCSLRDTTTVVIRPTPDKPTANSNSPVCELNSLQLTTSSSTTGVSYSWTGPNGYSNNTQNPTVTNSAGSTHAGDYISTATLNGCSSRDTTTVVILPKPAKPTASAPNSPLCARQNLQLNASTVTGAGYNWYGPAGYTANTQNPTRNYIQLNEGGKYYVYATVNGCISDTDSVSVVVNTDPVVNIFPTPGAVVCPNQQVIFTAIPTNGGTVGYQWFVNGVATGVSTLTYTTTTLNNNDKVYCLMASTGTCATPFTDTSNEITMTVKQALTPKVTITADAGPSLYPNEPINFTAVHTDAGAAPTFQWKKNGQNVNGANGQIWGANANFLNDGDDICVQITSSYDCPSPDTALSNCIKLDIRLSVEDVVNSNSIKVYPNPVKGTLRITSTTTIITITINNLLGQQLLQQTANGNTADIDMSALAAGVYVVKVNGVYAVRVTKE